MLFVKDHERFQMNKGNQVAPNIDEIGEVNFIKTQQYFDCRLCGKEFKTKNGVQGHHKREHLKRRFVCNECDAEFKLKVRVHHEGIKFGKLHPEKKKISRSRAGVTVQNLTNL